MFPVVNEHWIGREYRKATQVCFLALGRRSSPFRLIKMSAKQYKHWNLYQPLWAMRNISTSMWAIAYLSASQFWSASVGVSLKRGLYVDLGFKCSIWASTSPSFICCDRLSLPILEKIVSYWFHSKEHVKKMISVAKRVPMNMLWSI